jgi:hypothetical protein
MTQASQYIRGMGVKYTFISGVSHVGLQLFLAANIVDNPTISISHQLFAEPTKKTVTVSTVYQVSVA